MKYINNLINKIKKYFLFRKKIKSMSKNDPFIYK